MSLEMADSGQQPSAAVDNLVNEIFEMQMDMEIKGIDHSSHGQFSILYQGTCPPCPGKSVRSACANLCRRCGIKCRIIEVVAADWCVAKLNDVAPHIPTR